MVIVIESIFLSQEEKMEVIGEHSVINTCDTSEEENEEEEEENYFGKETASHQSTKFTRWTSADMHFRLYVYAFVTEFK